MPHLDSERDIIEGLLADAADALERGVIGKAKALYYGILAHQPRHAVALKRLAGLALNEGDPATALNYFERARAGGTQDADLCHGVASALRVMGDNKGFRLALQAALQIDPNYAPAIYDLAVFQQQRKNYAAAEKTYQRLFARGAPNATALVNAGVVAFRLGDLVAAERWFHAAAIIAPESARTFINLGMVYRTWGYVEQACACLARAVSLEPDNPEAHWNLANALLVSGDFDKGFAEYEWRFRRPGREERKLALPRWTGDDLGGRTLLLTLEQGLGDAIHFVRFAALAAARGACVVLECHAGLERLLATAPGVSATVTAGTPVPEAVCYLPLMSLPHVLGVSLDTIPADIPYLRAPENTPVPLPAGEVQRVGLVWRGNPKHEADAYRSVTLTQLAPLLDVEGVTWFSLQVGDGAAEIAGSPWAGRLTDLSAQLSDFNATASVVAQLDLVISVDTAVAHLAGALGKPVWTLIAEANDWRWLTRRGDSPWYPTMRLFRQHRGRNWGPVMDHLKTALTRRIARLVEKS